MSAKASSKDVTAFPQGRKNQDLLQRLNHLYQANTYLASLSTGNSASPDGGIQSSTGEKGRRNDESRDGGKNLDTLGVAVRRSNHRFKVMVKHNILATDPSLKRSFCKGCNTICIPGHNARVRVKTSKIHGNRIITTCLTCSTTRTIPAPPVQVAVAETVTSDTFPATSASEVLPQPHSIGPVDSPDATFASTASPSRNMRPLDGVNRSAKRQRLSRRAQFSRKEAVLLGLDGKPSSSVNKSSETLPPSLATTFSVESNAVQVHNPESLSADAPNQPASTDNIESRDPPHDPPAKQKQQKGQKGQNQKGKKSGKGGNAGAQPVKQDGHLLWRGDELVKGWGDPIYAATTASAV